MVPKEATYAEMGISAPNLPLVQQTATYNGSFCLEMDTTV